MKVTVLALFALCLFLASTVNAKAAVRVVHASPDAPNVDVYVNGSIAFKNVAFEDVTDYAFLPADYYNFVVVPTGASSPVVINATLPLSEETPYTIAATNFLAELTPAVFIDFTAYPIKFGNSAVRFVHLSPDAPAVDIAVVNGPTLFSNVTFGQATDYLIVPSDTYDLQVLITSSGAVALSIGSITLNPNEVYSAFAEGSAAAGTLAAVLAIDL